MPLSLSLPNKRRGPRAAACRACAACLLFFVASCEPDRPPGAESPRQPGETATRGNDFSRGRAIANAPASNAGAEVARRLAQREETMTTPQTSEEPATLIKNFAGATTERREEIVASLGASGAPEAWDFLRRQAVAAEQDIRLAALDAMAMHDGGDPSDTIANCLAFPDEETRALAATLLGRRVRDPEVWARAATDPSPIVRINYLSAVEEAPPPIRLAASRAALAAGDPQLRVEAASVLGGARNKEAVELLIPLLDDPAAGDVAADAMFFFFGRSFSSSAEARAWWSGQAASYAADLQPSEE